MIWLYLIRITWRKPPYFSNRKEIVQKSVKIHTVNLITKRSGFALDPRQSGTETIIELIFLFQLIVLSLSNVSQH